MADSSLVLKPSCPVTSWLCPSLPLFSSTFPPQGFPLLLSWPPAAHCEVGSRLLNWALTALLSFALMQVDRPGSYRHSSLPPSWLHMPFSIPTHFILLTLKIIHYLLTPILDPQQCVGKQPACVMYAICSQHILKGWNVELQVKNIDNRIRFSRKLSISCLHRSQTKLSPWKTL